MNLAYRWYLGYDLDEAIPDHSVLRKTRQASLHQRPGKEAKLAYKTHFVADEHQGVVTAVDETSVVLNVKKLPQVVSRPKAAACRAALGLGDFLSCRKICSFMFWQSLFVWGHKLRFCSSPNIVLKTVLWQQALARE